MQAAVYLQSGRTADRFAADEKSRGVELDACALVTALGPLCAPSAAESSAATQPLFAPGSPG